MGRRASLAKRRIFDRYAKRAKDRAVADMVWELRNGDDHQEWKNVSRLNTYLARKRVYDCTGDPNVSHIHCPFPFMGPEATPESVTVELRRLDYMLRTGDWDGENLKKFGA